MLSMFMKREIYEYVSRYQGLINAQSYYMDVDTMANKIILNIDPGYNYKQDEGKDSIFDFKTLRFIEFKYKKEDIIRLLYGICKINNKSIDKIYL